MLLLLFDYSDLQICFMMFLLMFVCVVVWAWASFVFICFSNFCFVVCFVALVVFVFFFFFFKQKTAYEMRISDWSSDVCSSDLSRVNVARPRHHSAEPILLPRSGTRSSCASRSRQPSRGSASGSARRSGIACDIVSAAALPDIPAMGS